MARIGKLILKVGGGLLALFVVLAIAMAIFDPSTPEDRAARAERAAQRAAESEADRVKRRAEFEAKEAEKAAAEQAKLKAFVEQVAETLQTGQPEWRELTAVKADPKDYWIRIDYKTAPLKGRVEADTKRVARAILGILTKEGRRPSSEHIAVTVSAWESGIKGETGEPLIADFGMTTYNWNNDQLEYRPAK